MYRREKYELLQQELYLNHTYEMVHHSVADYSVLKKSMILRPAGRSKDKRSLSDVIIMADTETSKTMPNATVKLKDGTTKYLTVQNHVCAWTISIRMNHCNLMTIWGHKPSTMMEAFEKILENVNGDRTIIYFHNMAYDYVFLRKFLFNKFGEPTNQLNTKSHYPINIEFENGLILRDSLILAQRGLDRWAKDMDVFHKKAVGLWNYEKIRNQDEVYTDDELKYIENDTLAGVECLDATINSLNTNLLLLPMTATGIPRTEMRKKAAENDGRETFLKTVPSLHILEMLMAAYHGGYTHQNRHTIGETLPTLAKDFASSYPYSIMCEEGPTGPFTEMAVGTTVEDILELASKYCFLFRVTFYYVRLKDDSVPMPALQEYKAHETVNSIVDNGRVLAASIFTITMTEMDLLVVADQYEWFECTIDECYVAQKGLLPKWFRDISYELFESKTMLKPTGSRRDNPVLYQIRKAMLNSLYGMCCQNPLKPLIDEVYESGEYITQEYNVEDLYNQWVNRKTSVLPYQWGVWVTANSFYRLHQLGKCAESESTWVYSDTDSCYFSAWDDEKLEAFNENIKNKVIAAGYGPVLFNNREYWPGIAETDGEYSEWVGVGAKRYAARTKEGKLKITVAGVPKSGVKCLNDDIRNFKTGLVFDGITTNKKTHTYVFNDDIEIDFNGNEVGDYIDLTPCDYLLDSTEVVDWEKLFEETLELEVYGNE